MRNIQTPSAIAHQDRMCEHMKMTAGTAAYTETDAQRGDLNLSKDGSRHRRYHALYEDMLN